jgi:hypothetical protein
MYKQRNCDRKESTSEWVNIGVKIKGRAHKGGVRIGKTPKKTS